MEEIIAGLLGVIGFYKRDAIFYFTKVCRGRYISFFFWKEKITNVQLLSFLYE